MSRNSNKLVWGVGRKGDGVTVANGKHTKAYITWRNMIARCYDPESLSRNPTYIGCSVCDAWLFFPAFNAWFNENYVEGFHLDKDLLIVGNKRYCPEACVFVPQSLNKLFTDSAKARGNYPIGVYFDKRTGKFRAQLNIDKKMKSLGYFDNPDEAHQAYLIAKKKNVIRVANEWKSKIPSRLFDALLTKAENV